MRSILPPMASYKIHHLIIATVKEILDRIAEILIFFPPFAHHFVYSCGEILASIIIELVILRDLKIATTAAAKNAFLIRHIFLENLPLHEHTIFK